MKFSTTLANKPGANFDSKFNLKAPEAFVNKSAFCDLKNITKVRPLSDKEKAVHAFKSSRLDYCNALLFGLNKNIINQL